MNRLFMFDNREVQTDLLPGVGSETIKARVGRYFSN